MPKNEEESVDELLQKLAKKGKKVKLLDESASVKELPKQEDVDDMDDMREARFGDDRVEDMDGRDDIDEEREDGMYGGRKNNKNFLSIEEQEAR